MDNIQNNQQPNNQPPLQQFNGGYVPPVKPKKPFYKKWWFWVIVAIVIISIISSLGGNNNIDETTTSTTSETIEENTSTKTEITTNYDASTEEGKIESIITDRISDKFDEYTQVEKITINEDLGTDKKGDYVALVYLTWTQENSTDTSKEVLKMYSSDLAATVGKETDSVQEIAIFWTVPYHGSATSKCAYERKNGNMYEMDTMWGF